MKEITNVRYSAEDNSQVEITFDDNSIFTQPHNEYRYRYTDQLNYWLEGKSMQWVEDAPPSELVPNTITPYDPNYGLTSEQIQARDIALAENIVKSYVQIPIDNYNQTHGVNFESVYNCTAYKDVDTYPHQVMCIQAIEWNAQVWESARQLQIDIALGNVAKPETEEEFISHLPAIPTFG